MSTTPTLRIDVLAPKREAIEIRSTLHPDARLYQFKTQAELSLEQLATLAALEEQVQPMLEHDGLSKAEGKLLDDLLAEIMPMIFHTPLEADVRAEMGPLVQWEVVNHFTNVCIEEPPATQTPAAPKRRKTSTGVS